MFSVTKKNAPKQFQYSVHSSVQFIQFHISLTQSLNGFNLKHYSLLAALIYLSGAKLVYNK